MALNSPVRDWQNLLDASKSGSVAVNRAISNILANYGSIDKFSKAVSAQTGQSADIVQNSITHAVGSPATQDAVYPGAKPLVKTTTPNYAAMSDAQAIKAAGVNPTFDQTPPDLTRGNYDASNPDFLASPAAQRAQIQPPPPDQTGLTGLMPPDQVLQGKPPVPPPAQVLQGKPPVPPAPGPGLPPPQVLQGKPPVPGQMPNNGFGDLATNPEIGGQYQSPGNAGFGDASTNPEIAHQPPPPQGPLPPGSQALGQGPFPDNGPLPPGSQALPVNQPNQPKGKQQQTGMNPWFAVVAAGLRTMASQNPNFLGALGEGGLTGLDTALKMNQQAMNAQRFNQLQQFREDQAKERTREFDKSLQARQQAAQSEADFRNKQLGLRGAANDIAAQRADAYQSYLNSRAANADAALQLKQQLGLAGLNLNQQRIAQENKYNQARLAQSGQQIASQNALAQERMKMMQPYYQAQTQKALRPPMQQNTAAGSPTVYAAKVRALQQELANDYSLTDDQRTQIQKQLFDMLHSQMGMPASTDPLGILPQ